MGKIIFFIAFALALSACRNDTRIELMGNWNFLLDKAGTLTSEDISGFSGTLRLPGSLQEQGYGEELSVDTEWVGQIVDSSWFYAPEYEEYREPGNVKLPFMLTPSKHYTGVVWYSRTIDIPQTWQDRPVEFFFERPHWETELYIDGQKLICDCPNSLSVPHRYYSEPLMAGKHTVLLRVDNRMNVDVGINAHSMTDHTQTPWNGVIGQMYAEAKPIVFQKNISVYPNIGDGSLKADFQVENTSEVNCEAGFSVEIVSSGKEKQVFEFVADIEPGVNIVSRIFKIDNLHQWDEFEPNMYRLVSELEHDGEKNVMSTAFGMRSTEICGRRILINGKPRYFRGTLDCCIFPDTGYPPMDKDGWRKVFGAVASYGLNHVRFHSWCPPKAAFEVADEMGLYLQIETCAWALTGEGTNYDSWVFEESDRIISEYGNHPSFMMLLAGNEPGGYNSAVLLDSLVSYWQSKNDHRQLYSSASGWPYVESADFFSTPDPRIQAWGAGQNSIINAKLPQTRFDFSDVVNNVNKPVISHEMGQWCVFPNFDEIKKYNGFLKAGSYEIFRDFMEKKSMSSHWKDFEQASGYLQVLCYKADIEAALRTRDMAGFQLLGIQDYHGHGDAIIGVADAFWEPKSYESREHFRMFCGSTVPLAYMDKFVWSNSEIFEADIKISHFGSYSQENATVNWKLSDSENNIFASETVTAPLIAGQCNDACVLKIVLDSIDKPVKMVLEVSVPEFNARNEWNIWVYPEHEVCEENVCMTKTLDQESYECLQNGGTVILFLPQGSVKPEYGGDISVGFSPIFWNSAYTSGQPPHLLGICCDDRHPIFTDFPTESHTDYQWWGILHDANAMILDDFPTEFEPIVYLIDDWYKNRKLGLVYEACVLNGKIIVVGKDLTSDNLDLSSRQLKNSILKYAVSPEFNPEYSLDYNQISNMLQ